MFTNLIESCSHRNEVQRRSYFFLFTTATYALLLTLAGVASIYAYDARVKEPDMQLTLLTFAPTDVKFETPEKPLQGPKKAAHGSDSVRPVGPVLIDSSSNPNNPPETVGTTAPIIPPAPVGAEVGNYVMDPPGFAGGENQFGGDRGAANSGVRININDTSPPPAPTPSPKRTLRTSKILNSQAIALPKPLYPPIAKIAGVQGVVSIQVLIDETGKVISAKALSGSPLLQPEAVKAAYQARFSPTTIDDQPVKVSGLITYNFLLH